MSDWLMVIITFVYTVTTIFIGILNYKTVKIATRQYYSDIQLRLMPCLYIQLAKSPKGIHKRITLNTNTSNSASIVGEFAFSLQNVGNGVAKEIQYELPENTETDFFYRIISLPCQDKRDFIIRIIHGEESLEKSKHLISEIRVTYKDLLDCKYSQIMTILVCLSKGKMELETFYLTAPECIKNTYTEKHPKMCIDCPS